MQARAGLVNSTAVGLDICNLNNRTNKLCETLKAAQVKVFEGNCIYAGLCAPQLFVYAPGMYSSSNRDFVRGTVADFYEMFKQQTLTDSKAAFAFDALNTDDSEKVCPSDDMELALKIRNEAMKQRCAAVQLDHLKTVLMAVRKIVDTIVATYYIMLQILLGLFRLLIPGLDSNEVVSEIEFWFIKLIGIAIDAIKQIVNMLFRMLFNWGEFGKIMKAVIKACLLFHSTYCFTHAYI